MEGRDERTGTSLRTSTGTGGEQQTALVSRAVKRAQTGDRDALAFLYARYADDVSGCVRSIVRDGDDAQDVTRDVFDRLGGMIGTYGEREMPFWEWMLALARSLAVDYAGPGRPVAAHEARSAMMLPS